MAIKVIDLLIDYKSVSEHIKVIDLVSDYKSVSEQGQSKKSCMVMKEKVKSQGESLREYLCMKGTSMLESVEKKRYERESQCNPSSSQRYNKDKKTSHAWYSHVLVKCTKLNYHSSENAYILYLISSKTIMETPMMVGE